MERQPFFYRKEKEMRKITICWALLFFIFAGCEQDKEVQVKSISPVKAAGLQANQFGVIVDVREEAERKSGMVRGALVLPATVIESEPDRVEEFVSRLDREKKVILYCGSGKRAQRFAQYLAGKGFDVANMGGFEDWKKAGLPVSQ